MKTSKKGFSLIELLVVIAIIAILTAIITTNLTQSRGKSRDAKRVSDLAQIQLSLELFFDRCNGYPAALSGATSLITITSCPSGINLGTFLGQIPTGPTTGETYLYVPNSASPATDYILRARLEYNNVSVLTDDVDDGSAFSSTDCTDTSANYYYCVQPK